jgi:hypothetical protein
MSKLIVDEIEKFFAFITERQNIFHRRFVVKQPPPWTEDSILQVIRLENIYRELDRGTQFCIKNIFEHRRAV